MPLLPRRPLALVGVVVSTAVAAALALSPAAQAAGLVGPGTPAAPNPASGLQLLRTVEAGHQTQVDTGTNGNPFQADTTIEPSIAVNPANPLEIVTGFQTGRDDAGGGIDNGFATSHDGGKTYVSGAMPGLTATSPSPTSTYTRASDAVVVWGPGETVYYSSLVFDPSGLNLVSAIVDSTSTDGGLTWGLPSVVQSDPGLGLNDKNWVTVDRSSAAGHHLGRVYVVWDRVAGVFTKYSDDGGVTWNPPSPVIVPLTFQGQGISAIPVVLPSGALTVVFESSTAPPAAGENGEALTNISKFVSATAPLAGSQATGTPIVFEPAVGIASYTGTAVRGQRAGGLIAATVDDASGRIYATFEGTSTRTDGNNDVLLTHSDDSGTTWTTPVRVDCGPTDDEVDHYNPSVAVGPDHSVRVFWRQRQETAAAVSTFSPYISTWVAQSADGTTFAPALQVDSGTNDERYGAFSRGGTFQGDYDQLVTVGDTSYLVYCDSHSLSDAETPPATPSATTVHHQRTIVSIVQPTSPTAPAAALPDVRQPGLWLLTALGLGTGVVLLTRRRRTG